MGAEDFNFDFRYIHQDFTLPPEVLGSENLKRLHVDRCKIEMTDKKVSCWKLKSLFIWDSYVEGDIVRDLISKCPLIEEVTLVRIKHKHMHLRRYGLIELGSSNVYKNLRSLFLAYVNVDNPFFSNLSSNFPCLKELTIEGCSGNEHNLIQISSRSLECISFKDFCLWSANFDVPSIRKFKFLGLNLPALLFKTASREWESDIRITCHSSSMAWFLELKKLLTSLSSSKISLTLNIWSIEKSVDFRGLPETPVENLTIYHVSFRGLDGLFWSCRPKFIALHNFLYLVRELRKKGKNDFVKIVSKRNVEGLKVA